MSSIYKLWEPRPHNSVIVFVFVNVHAQRVNVIVKVIVERLLSIDSNLLSILDIDTTRGIRHLAALEVVVGNIFVLLLYYSQ